MSIDLENLVDEYLASLPGNIVRHDAMLVFARKVLDHADDTVRAERDQLRAALRELVDNILNSGGCDVCGRDFAPNGAELHDDGCAYVRALALLEAKEGGR